ncbi:Abortive infection protein [Granulicella tundricola MP5ACTX9]|uniref:Abortive infection protein n=2 Tax=Granulicella TaxID=940557 RepID=E8X2V1_GRATM|nr:Abortive infection protein [Granulicella tundricola MP5ACTX9]
MGLLMILALSTFTGHRRLLAFAHHPSIPFRYGSSIVLEWLLLGFVLARIRNRKAFLLQAFRSRSSTWLQSLGNGIAAYCLGFVAIAIVAIAIHFTPLGTKTNAAAMLAMLPRTTSQFALWLALSLTAGICEELIFRGYLTQQFTAWIRRPVLALVLSSLLFGSVHLYEGLAAILPLAALALVYGFIVRSLKGDIRAVIVAHTLQDFLVAVLALARPMLEHYRMQH